MRYKLAEIDGVAAMGSGDQRQGCVGTALLDGCLIETHHTKPPHQIVSAISARHTLMPADGQVDVSTRPNELLGDLGARGSRANDQYGSPRKLVRLLVCTRVDLKQGAVVERQIGKNRSLVRTGCDHDVRGVDRACRSLDEIRLATLAPPQRGHRDAAKRIGALICRAYASR